MELIFQQSVVFHVNEQTSMTLSVQESVTIGNIFMEAFNGSDKFYSNNRLDEH